MARKRKGTNTGIPGLSFSWRQATGVTRMKRKVARATGIPTTRSGRQRKFGKMASGGCLALVLNIVGLVLLLSVGFVGGIHDGRNSV